MRNSIWTNPNETPWQPKEEASSKDTLWNLPKEEASQAPSAQKEAQPDKIKQLASKLHGISYKEDGAPDWEGHLLEAKNGYEKMQIRAMRETWEEEQKFLAYQKAQAVHEARIKEVLSNPHRNKFFYERLQAEEPKVYWSEDCQRMMRKDKQAMGLGFHLKG